MTGTPINISAISNVFDNTPSTVTTTWGKFIDTCRTPEVRGELPLTQYLAASGDVKDRQKNGPAVICGEFRDGKRSKGSLVSLSLIPLDLDDGFYTFDMLEKALSDMGVEAVIHTSYSNSPEKAKLRAYILLKTPIINDLEAVHNRIVAYLESMLGRHLDDKCYTVSQLYFLPSCPPDALEQFRFAHIPGDDPIDPADFQLTVDKGGVKASLVQSPSGGRPGDDFNQRGSWREILIPLGWTFFRDRDGNMFWTRPGKRWGVSGVVFADSGLFYVHSSAEEVAPFEAGKAYSLFSAYTLINHGGDYSAAASALAAEGYGDHKQSSYAVEAFPSYGEEEEQVSGFDLSCLTLGSAIADGDYSVSFVVDKLIPENAVVLFYAKGGSGKSTLATQIGGAVAAEKPFMGLNTSKRPVIIIDYENPLAVLSKRIKAVEGAGDIHFWTGGNSPPQMNKGEWRELERLIAALKNPLIIIDTLSSSCSDLDILSNGDFSPVMRKIIALRNLGATIVLLHHTPKQDETKYIGASCIYNQCDHILAMYPVKVAGAEKEASDEDEAKVYRLGTRDKTRFEHHTLYVEFDDDQSVFVPAEDPDKELIDRLKRFIEEKAPVNQGTITDNVGAPKGKVKQLLKQNERYLWTVERGANNAKIYQPIRFAGFSPLYIGKTEKPEKGLSGRETGGVMRCEKPNNPQHSQPSLNSGFVGFSQGGDRPKKPSVVCGYKKYSRQEPLCVKSDFAPAPYRQKRIPDLSFRFVGFSLYKGGKTEKPIFDPPGGGGRPEAVPEYTEEDFPELGAA